MGAFFPECGNNFDVPQVQLPIFPAGFTHINSEVAFKKRCTTLTAICRCQCDGRAAFLCGQLVPSIPDY